MIEHAPATEHEMILAFLQAEIPSPQFGHLYEPWLRQLGCDHRIIKQADLASAPDNMLRKQLLTAVRGYSSRTFLFTGFPADVQWRHVTLTPEEVRELRYAKDDNWVQLSGGTRLVEDGAKNPSNKTNKSIIAIAKAVQQGSTFPALIAATNDAGLIVLIEGHNRATAYAIMNVPANIILGTSSQIANWKYWGSPGHE